MFFIHGVSEAAYKIHLKNGGVISEIANIKENAEIVEVNKNGIMLKLRKSSISKIEEYNTESTGETRGAQEQETEQELPEYLKHKKHSYAPMVQEQPAEEETQKAEETKNADQTASPEKDSKISKKYVDSLPSSPQSKKLKDFVNKLPPKAVGP